MELKKYHILFNGLTAGNIGDEMMFLGFLSIFDLPEGTTIEVYDSRSEAIRHLPKKFKYIDYTDIEKCNEALSRCDIALVIGTTMITTDLGLHWPLIPLNKRAEACVRFAKPFHFLGIGADEIKEEEEARELFSENIIKAESWTVRSENSKNNLLDLGVEPKKIVVAADFAWLSEKPKGNFIRKIKKKFRKKAKAAVNLVGEKRFKDEKYIGRLAKITDFIIEDLGCEVTLFCNEVRSGEQFDYRTSQKVLSMMRNKAKILENNYFSPSEMINFLSDFDWAFPMRYHACVEAAVAGIPFSVLARSPKMYELCEDLGIEVIAQADDDDLNSIFSNLKKDFSNRKEISNRIANKKFSLRKRAAKNTYFI